MAATLLALLLLAAGDGPVDEPSARRPDGSTLAEKDKPPGDEAAGDVERQRQEEVAALAPAKAKALVVLVGEQQTKASLRAEPLLRWSNPTAGSVHGEVFLWHVEGRPVAAASIFRWYHPYKDVTIEIVSLSPSSVSASEGKEVLWDSRSAGVTFHELTGAPAPATARGGRLSQMRAAARRFEARLKDERGGERVERQLRLLNQPIHRYESAKQGVIDGALFALAEVTDPEVVVMIEAVKAGDSRKWRYALARMNNHELEVRLDGKAVQTFRHIDGPWKDRTASYRLFTFDPAAVKVEPAKKP
jgi:hypothetical protein